jgi:hypothetical protein
MFRDFFAFWEQAQLAVVAVCVVVLSAFMGTSYGFQRTSAFEVAAVKSNRSNEPPSSLFPLGPGDAYVANGGLFSARNQPLLQM